MNQGDGGRAGCVHNALGLNLLRYSPSQREKDSHLTEKATNSQILEARQEGVAVARVHPRRAAAEGFADGDLVDLVSARGRLSVRLALDPATRPDTVLVQKGEWLKRGRCLSVLTAPCFTAGTGAAFNQSFVRLERS